MTEFYPEDLVARSRELWQHVKAWGATRNDVIALGGWAVYELVDLDIAQQSKDVDIVLHSQAAINDFRRRMRDWDLV